MMSINGHDINSSFRSGGRRNQGNGMPRPNFKNPKQREVAIGEFEGEKLSGEERAEERSLVPGRGQATGVIGVEMREEVDLAVIAPPIHRYHPFLHSSKRSRFPFGMERGVGSWRFVFHFGGKFDCF